MLGWRRLEAEIAHWREAGHRPRLWWRDDDARTDTPQLRRLIVQVARADLPLCLGVIPDGLDRRLCVAVAPFERIVALQHGVDHVDRTGAPSEFRPDESADRVASRLREGWAALEGFGRRLPVYIPPWNAITPNVEAALGLSGHQGLSAWAGLSRPGRTDAHIDLLHWRGGPRFAGHERILVRLTEALRLRRREGRWDDPVGLLTHHLVHDEPAWRFLDELLLSAPLQECVDWPDPDVLFGLDALAPVSEHVIRKGVRA
jgi:hypothetical protein